MSVVKGKPAGGTQGRKNDQKLDAKLDPLESSHKVYTGDSPAIFIP